MMNLLAIGDGVWIAIVGVLGTIFGTYLTHRLNQIAEVGRITHELVNSGALIQLKLNSELSTWKANETKKPADIEAAKKAELMYLEHAKKQAEITAGDHPIINEPEPKKRGKK